MTRRLAPFGLVLAVVALLCWLAMFLSATDVWHDTGRVDLWHLEGAPYTDLRAFVLTFYVLLPVLVAQVVIGAANVLRRRTPART